MQLYAYDKHGEPLAAAYGAYLAKSGRLRCPLLFVKYGNTHKQLMLKSEEYSFLVELPEKAVDNESHYRGSYQELEVINEQK